MGLNQDVHVNLLIISVGKKCIPSNVLKIFENQYNKSSNLVAIHGTFTIKKLKSVAMKSRTLQYET